MTVSETENGNTLRSWYLGDSYEIINEQVINPWTEEPFTISVKRMTFVADTMQGCEWWLDRDGYAMSIQPGVIPRQSAIAWDTQHLSISCSRWGHELRLRQVHTLGESFVSQYGSSGEIYEGSQASYFYFLARFTAGDADADLAAWRLGESGSGSLMKNCGSIMESSSKIRVIEMAKTE